MTNAVDLEILISNSGGDDDFVREIISMSVEQIEEQLAILKTLCIDGPSEEWVHNAHALKGSAATLGAEAMRRLCEVAQKQMADTTGAARQGQLNEIEKKYADVRQSLVEQGYLAA